MDPISIATAASLVTSAWKILEPFAKKIAGKLGEKATEALPEVTGKVWDTVKEKLEAQPGTKDLPADLAKTPEDPMVQVAFQYQLKKLLENDEAFAKQLDGLLKEAAKQTVTNVTKYEGEVKGSGALAQGTGATAVGAGGISIGGNVENSNIVTGNNNKIGRLAGDASTDAPPATREKE